MRRGKHTDRLPFFKPGLEALEEWLQSGDVRVIKNGSLLSTVLFHFNDVDSNGERGVLGVAPISTRTVLVIRTTTAARCISAQSASSTLPSGRTTTGTPGGSG